MSKAGGVHFNRILSATSVAVFSLVMIFSAASAEAFQIKRIVRGSIDFASSDQQNPTLRL